MKIIEKVEIDSVTDVMCDVCLCSTRVANVGLEFATLQAHWGYGAKHDGERYELHLCESCFFGTVAYLKQERRIQNLFSEEVGIEANEPNSTFGLVASEDYFRDDVGSKL
ncbi:hypothetical protein ACT3TQ_05945 [Halomonas sp. AOP12-C2-37]|jgi:predicted DsbA family dithiol-disulfide isomerase|uniref:Uncharacterized protein n=4 Tax=Gammaproteobacteria TaxID=1236 RepID=A0A368LG71_9VIBR|nr:MULTISPECIES: hypothetical protein [Gammaproteobacteria]MBE0401940.1 hypothetical protein [Halomonas casei]MBE0402936.1 hypothetical protein [Halomonas citrativorans]PCC21150.1 hypothetical protein CIK78_03110 [Halomonas sp. JB37]RCS68723.1 hypothetical protein CIK83_17610 [Vibrio casei]HCR95966.1 hypothetical protein [Halomonas sp.]